MDWGAGCLDEKRREAGSRRREAEWNGMHTHARLVCAVSAAGARRKDGRKRDRQVRPWLSRPAWVLEQDAVSRRG